MNHTIEFAEWLLNNAYPFKNEQGDNKMRWFFINTWYTTNEIYNIYLKQKESDKNK